MEAEFLFRAMGSECHVLVVGDHRLRTVARRRLDDLERRWSRFLPDSEISRLNASRGVAHAVSQETFDLVALSIEGWIRTGGLFDPTVLGDVLRAGYDRSFERLAVDSGSGTRGVSVLRRNCAGIEINAVARTVRLPRDTGFDPGGIGKGLAADIVARELMDAGADGACVNVGGDLRVEGEGPDDGRWIVGIDHPGRTERAAVLALAGGGVATSTPGLRRWVFDGVARNHLVDPVTGTSYDGASAAVSAVAREAAWAEVAAKAALFAPAGAGVAMLDKLGADGIVAYRNGTTARTPGLAGYLVAPPELAGHGALS